MLASSTRWSALVGLAASFAVACGPGGGTGVDEGREAAPRAATSGAVAVDAEAARRAEEARERMQPSEGGRLLLMAIDAHGGLERWFATSTSSFGWEYSNLGADLRFKSEMVADNRDRRVYHDVTILGTPDDPRPFEGRMAWDGTEAWFSPAEATQLNARFWALTGYYFQLIPFVFADPGINYESLPDEELDGATYDMVKVTYDPGIGDASDYYIVYVDQETRRVRAIRYVVTFGGREPGPETLFYYNDLQTVDGLTVATAFEGYRFADGQKGEHRSNAWATDIDFSVPFDDTRLEQPPDSRVDPLPGGDRESAEVSDAGRS